MNNFHKLIQNIDLIFGRVKDYFFITEFQFGGLFYDHRLLWLKNALIFGVSKNEKNECLINKYLIIDQTMPSNEICNIIHNINIKEHVEKNVNQFDDFNIQKKPMKNTKILFPLDEQDHMLNYGEINIQIYKKLVILD
jgi:hypothetical protein